jgi:hypothetical protein
MTRGLSFQTPHHFKNFHRLLCERFGYVHDDVDWWRDQISLIEHIAALHAKQSASDGARDRTTTGRVHQPTGSPSGPICSLTL